MGHNRLAGSCGQHIRAQTDDTTRGNRELQTGATAIRFHIDERAFALGSQLDNRTCIFVGTIDGHLLDRLALDTVDLLNDNLRLTDLQFVALAAHRLNQHREVQHTTTIDVEAIGIDALFDAQSEVLFELTIQTLLDVARGYILAVLAEEWRVVDREQHRHRRLVNSDRGQRLGVLIVANGVADLETLDTDQRADFAATDTLDLRLAQTLEYHQLLDLGLLHRLSVALCERNILSCTQFATCNLTYGNTTHVGRIFERCDQHLGRTLDHFGLGNLVDDCVEQRGNATRRLLPLVRHPALLGRTVNRLVIKLFLRSVEREHQVENLLIDHLGAAVGFIDFVDHHDRFLAQRESLLQYESCLWHCALEGVDQQQHAVAHIQHALDLTAKVGVARGVDDIDFVIFVDYRHIFREDRDTTFALQIVIVEDKVAALFLVVSEQVTSQNHLVDQRCFAVVDVRDDCDIA